MLVIIRLFGRREYQPHSQPARDVDRLDRSFAFGEPAEEQQVIVGALPEREPVGVDAVQHGADHVEARKEPRLLIRDGDVAGLRVVRPQLQLGLAGRVMQRLDDRRRRQPREGERHRIVGRFVVDDVEAAGALDGRRQVEHLVELPRPHVLVVPVAVGERRVQLPLRLGVGRAEQGDVEPALDETFREQGRHLLHRSGLGRRNARGNRADVSDPQAHAVTSSRSRPSTRSATKCSRAIAAASRAWRG